MTDQILLENEQLYQAIITAAKSVIKHKETLNELNVFPVRDKDTGSNLSALMSSIIELTKKGNSISETLESVSEAALLGSRGNSGLIFSQFLYGFTLLEDDKKSNDIKLIERVKSGVSYAYEALENPLEGTMITLMRQWLEYLLIEKENHDSIKAYLLATSQKLKIALEETKNTLDILKKHNVVDAGALGFTLFVEGFIEGLIGENKIVAQEFKVDLPTLSFKEEHIHNDNTRYCTEVLLQTTISKDVLTKIISNLGDSVVVGESKRLKRIHIHTNHPEKVLYELSSLGQILESKVDDMLRQQQIQLKPKYKIAIVTDSIADIPKEIIDHYQIHVYPVGINIDDVIFYDKLTIHNEQFFKYILNSKTYPKSFAPNPKSVEVLLATLAKHYKHILVLTVSGKMSGTYNIFNKIANSFLDTQIKVIDTKQNSVSQGLLVMKIAELIDSGMDFNQIEKKAIELTNKTKILVHVETLDLMVRSGRIKKSLGKIGKILHLKPIVSIDSEGNGIVLSKSIGQKNNINKIVKYIKKIHQSHGIEKYALVHLDNLKLAEKIKTKVIDITGFKPEYMSDISTIIAMNSGKGSVGIAYIRKD
ncbi:DegV family protein [Acholeplasma granularum]|uniref:DegV family protein n=1 Tax=Acholeplasma granularum TaxID=264635 RepID=UPI000470A1D6|nr:DegV family protein [Acholeplasma granularum]